MIFLAKRHLGAIVIAVFVGLLFFLPNIINLRVSTPPLNLEEIFSYGVKVREVMDGHWRDGDPYLAEYKNQFMTWDYYPLSIPLGLLARLLQLDSPEQLFIWLDLVLPPITFLIIYFLFFGITNNQSWSLLSSFIFTAFPNLLAYRKVLNLKDGFAWLGTGFNHDFSRLFVPALTMIFFSAFLLAFSKLYKNEKSKWYQIIVAGISYGLLFYVYFYYWVFATIALILGIIILWLMKDKKKGEESVIAFGIGIAISLLHWFRYFLLSENPNFKEYVSRVGIEYTHAPRWESLDFVILVMLLGVILWFLRKLIGMRTVIFLVSLLAATIVVLNIQVVFGFTPQPDHWTSRVNLYIFILSLMIVLFFIARTYSFVRWSKGMLIAILVISFSAQIQAASATRYDFGPSSEFRAAYRWINQNVPRDAVMVTPSVRSRMLLPYFTHANVYLPMACLSLAPQEEIIDRYREVYSAFKIPKELVFNSLVIPTDTSSKYDQAIYLEEIETNFAIFCDKFNPAYRRGQSDKRELQYRGAPEELITQFMADYQGQPSPDFKNLKRRADFIFWGPGEKLISQIDPVEKEELELAYSNDLVKIFSIKR